MTTTNGNIVIGARSMRIDEVATIPVDAQIQKKMDQVMKVWDNKRRK